MKDKQDLLLGKKILLVDDCEINLFIIKSVLDELKIETDVCISGIEAIMKIIASNQNYYDLILMDIQMPEMDGIQTTKIIRNLDRIDTKKIPIIAVSATYPKDKVNELFKIGINEFITKPIDYKIFKNKLNMIFKKNSHNYGY